ncbi:MAG: pyrimidine reductase [Chloroflexi bacterium HGW-Chloroflexi-4]|jgi:dihydrofolate reductase|nr:MAG: pyrimidine reductase [Chloroflexi bacterium HGW-Chloroflexi-4]
MGRIIVSEFVSLDGVMEAPGGEPGYKHTGWVAKFQDEQQIKFKLEEVLAVEALLLGRKTYEGFSEAWPFVSGKFGDKMNSLPKFIASTTLKNVSWNNSKILGPDTLSEVKKIKNDFQGDVMVNGSRTLVNFLKLNHLVDEYRLMIFPIVLGSGMRLFDEVNDFEMLKLVDSHPFKNGAIILTYQPTI